MKEYIEREALIYAICNSTEPFNTGSVMRVIKRQPAADVVERKRGEWEYLTQDFSDGMVMDDFGCSECDHVQTIPMNGWLPNFCPNCGADMRGDGK